MAANFDLSALALKAICPSNEILYDDVGMPSIMVKIPKMTYADLGLGISTATFPAFLVNGSEVDEIYISKYQNIVQNGRAYSLPGQDPKTSITFDKALEVCAAKGAGWHLMTAFEWGALILWCEKNGFIPLGNNAYGKHNTETNYKAIPATKDDTHYAVHTATGTGPLTWYHNQAPDGIADLCGNVFEWTGGLRLVYGELQVLVNNNAADTDNPQTAASTLWMAIDATTGELITPDGSGTTSNSIKADWISSKITWNATITDANRGSHYCMFQDIGCSESIADEAKTVLRSLGMLPIESTIITGWQRCYVDNSAAERSLYRGGYYASSLQYGFASFYLYYARSHSNAAIGFRSAYCKLPAA